MIFIILVLLILLNGLLSLSETAVVTARKGRLQAAAEEGNKKAAAALRLANRPTRFLSTIQIGITMVGLFTGAFGEAMLARKIESWFRSVPILWIVNHSETLALATMVIGLTYFTLLFGELIPKRLALAYPETIAAYIAGPMKWLSRIAAPLVGFLSFSTDAVLGVFGFRQKENDPISPEELKVLIKQGADAGIFEKTERDIVNNVFRLADRRASTLMTPRTDIVWIDLNESEDAIRTKMIEEPHAFIPVGQGSLDHVVGVLSAKDCLARVLQGEAIDVDQMMHRPLIIPESVSTLELLEFFRESPAEIALISNEFGSILGAVTQNDVLEAIVGDLPSAEESVEPNAVQREDGSWLVNGSMPADELKELLRVNELPADNHYDTVGGFIMLQLQAIPSVSDSFEWNKWRFEVVDLDGKRIDKVMISPVGEAGRLSS